MNTPRVQEHFQQQAREYSALMARLLPEYHDKQAFLVELIRWPRDQGLRVLDLGCGNGLLAGRVLDRFPRAEVVAFDLTGAMLDACRETLKTHLDRLTLRQGDYRFDDIGSGYQVILTGMTLHHLVARERQEMFRRLHDALLPGGQYLTRDIVVDADSVITAENTSWWRAYMQSQGEDDAFWHAKHLEKDHPETVEDLQAWLRQAGFAHVVCHWKLRNVAIVEGRKAAENPLGSCR